MNNQPTLRPRSGRELVLSRIIDAPRERVFAAWVGRLPDWWGPHGTTTRVCEMELRPGGAFRTVMRAADGTEYPTRGVFLEIMKPERIVFTDAYDPGWQPHPALFFTGIATFESLPDDRTRYTMRARHWTPAARERHERMGFYEGWGESLDRLAAVAMQG